MKSLKIEGKSEVDCVLSANCGRLFQVAAKLNNVLSINVLPTKPPVDIPPVDVVFDDKETVDVTVDVKSCTATATKAQSEVLPDVVVMETSAEQDSYIAPTTDDCKLL